MPSKRCTRSKSAYAVRHANDDTPKEYQEFRCTRLQLRRLSSGLVDKKKELIVNCINSSKKDCRTSRRNKSIDDACSNVASSQTGKNTKNTAKKRKTVPVKTSTPIRAPAVRSTTRSSAAAKLDEHIELTMDNSLYVSVLNEESVDFLLFTF